MTPARPGPGPFTWDSPFVRALATQLVRLEHPRTAQGASFALLTVLDAETRANPLYPTAPDALTHIRALAEALATITEHVDTLLTARLTIIRHLGATPPSAEPVAE